MNMTAKIKSSNGALRMFAARVSGGYNTLFLRLAKDYKNNKLLKD